MGGSLCPPTGVGALPSTPSSFRSCEVVMSFSAHGVGQTGCLSSPATEIVRVEHADPEMPCPVTCSCRGVGAFELRESRWGCSRPRLGPQVSLSSAALVGPGPTGEC